MEILSVSKATVEQLQKDKGALIKEIEKRGKVEITIDADSNLELEGESGDVWVAEQVLKALDYGFLPQRAFKLFNDNYFLEIIDLELIFSNPKAIDRNKGRVIGAGGRAKRTIEELSGAFLAISNKKIAVLGDFESLQLAKEAVLRLLEGSMHNSVYAYLEKKSKESKYNLK